MQAADVAVGAGLQTLAAGAAQTMQVIARDAAERAVSGSPQRNHLATAAAVHAGVAAAAGAAVQTATDVMQAALQAAVADAVGDEVMAAVGNAVQDAAVQHDHEPGEAINELPLPRAGPDMDGVTIADEVPAVVGRIFTVREPYLHQALLCLRTINPLYRNIRDGEWRGSQRGRWLQQDSQSISEALACAVPSQRTADDHELAQAAAEGNALDDELHAAGDLPGAAPAENAAASPSLAVANDAVNAVQPPPTAQPPAGIADVPQPVAQPPIPPPPTAAPTNAETAPEPAPSVAEEPLTSIHELPHSVVLPTAYDLPPDAVQQAMRRAAGSRQNAPLYQLQRVDGAPVSLHLTPNVELLAHPDLYPYGQGACLGNERPAEQSLAMCYRRRLWSFDPRFRQSHPFIMFVVCTERHVQLQGAIGAAMRLNQGPTGVNALYRNLQQARAVGGGVGDREGALMAQGNENTWAYMRNLRGTAAYWSAASREVFAMIRHLGPPTFFITLSANDMGWDDLALVLRDGPPFPTNDNGRAEQEWLQVGQVH